MKFNRKCTWEYLCRFLHAIGRIVSDIESFLGTCSFVRGIDFFSIKKGK